MAFVTAMMAESGLPLFTRASKGLESLSYSAIGSLFGITTYVEDQQAKIRAARTSTAAVQWKVIQKSKLLLVVVADNDYSTDDHIDEFLDLVYSAIVFTIGEGDLARLSAGSEEVYRLELKKCYALIDALLNTLRSSTSAGPSLHCVDRSVVPVDATISAALDRFVYGASAKWGFLLVNGQVYVADTQWWDLRTDEKVLLSMLPPTLEGIAEATVYLPCASPSVPFRLVSAMVSPGVHACFLCGAQPSLNAIETQLLKPVWGGQLESLRKIQAKPASVPPAALQVTEGVIGMLIVDPAAGWSMFFHADGVGPGVEGAKPKLAASAYYKSVIGPCVMKTAPVTSLGHTVTESYTVTTQYKLYFMEHRLAGGDLVRVVGIFMPGSPTYALRHLTTTTFTDLEACNVFPLS